VATDLHAAKDRQAILQTDRGRNALQAEIFEKPYFSTTAIGRKLPSISSFHCDLNVRTWPKADCQIRGVGSVSMTAIE
jgi:hypothetical protein